ncbi:MAG: YjfB family protein [Selenomonadaceae bacterium]|nr:YjfB family protein [Selenomonadaceae bacterium]
MDYAMDIAAASVNLHAFQTSQQLNTAVLKMAMETQTSAMTDLLESIDAADIAAMTGVGMNLDIMA